MIAMPTARTPAPTNDSRSMMAVLTAGPGLRGTPGLVVACRARAMPAAEIMARRNIGFGGAGVIGLVRRHPWLVLGGRQHVRGRAMQPGMPFRRHSRSLGLALIDHPAPRLVAGARAAL